MYPLSAEIQKDFIQARRATQKYMQSLWAMKALSHLPHLVIADTLTPGEIETATEDFYTKRVDAIREKWTPDLTALPARIREQVWNEARKQPKSK